MFDRTGQLATVALTLQRMTPQLLSPQHSRNRKGLGKHVAVAKNLESDGRFADAASAPPDERTH